MDRTLKSPLTKPQQGQSVFVLPGTAEAEPWEVWIADGQEKSRCIRTCASPHENPWQRRSTLVFPVSQVFCLPLWLNETAPDRLPEMIELQMESRGFAGRADRTTVYQWDIAAREGKRTLVLVGILPSALPEAMQVNSYRSFDVSAHYFPWPRNALTIWREQGKLAATFTRNESVIYFQDLADEQCSDRTIETLVCLRASLEIQQVLPTLSEIVVWADLSPQEMTRLAQVMALPPNRAEGPAPRQPARPWNLCPPEVSLSLKKNHARRWKTRAIYIALLIYVVLVAGLITQFLLAVSRVDALEKWQSEHASALASIYAARDDWRRLDPVVETSNYPLEILLNTANAIPKDQLHLTLFEMDDGKVQLQGEATNVASAYVFFDRLKAEPKLAAYKWQMDEPHLLPNDLAQLQIEGSRATANP